MKKNIRLYDKNGKVWRIASENDDLKSYNPINGCNFVCYGGNCWAAQEAKRQQKYGNRGYDNGFKPSFMEEKLKIEEYRKAVSDNDYVWIGSMGDIAFQPTHVMKKIIDRIIKAKPLTMFFLETKNPETYNRFIDDLPENVMISTTLETNRGYGYGKNYAVSKAPEPKERYEAFRDLKWDRKHVSIEPVMDFDVDIFVEWLRQINPEMLWIGYANHGLKLPKPSFDKILELMERLAKFTRVEPKDNVIARMSDKQLNGILKRSGWSIDRMSTLDDFGI